MGWEHGEGKRFKGGERGHDLGTGETGVGGRYKPCGSCPLKGWEDRDKTQVYPALSEGWTWGGRHCGKHTGRHSGSTAVNNSWRDMEGGDMGGCTGQGTWGEGGKHSRADTIGEETCRHTWTWRYRRLHHIYYNHSLQAKNVISNISHTYRKHCNYAQAVSATGPATPIAQPRRTTRLLSSMTDHAFQH